jgi:hypothetical protein
MDKQEQEIKAWKLLPFSFRMPADWLMFLVYFGVCCFFLIPEVLQVPQPDWPLWSD